MLIQTFSYVIIDDYKMIFTYQKFMKVELHNSQNIIHSHFMEYAHKNNLSKTIKNQKNYCW